MEALKSYEGDPLTLRDLQIMTGLGSHNLVLHHLKQLEKRGLLRRNPSNPGDYQVLDENPESQVNYINLYGMAECGPNGQFLEGTPIDKIPISSRMFGFSAADAFLVKARGRSMEPMIHNGDLVVAQKNRQAKDGDIVICTYGGVAMIKRFRQSTNDITLESLNKDKRFEPIPVKYSEDFNLAGVVRGVYASV